LIENCARYSADRHTDRQTDRQTHTTDFIIFPAILCIARGR
jgi:hypothetical protein